MNFRTINDPCANVAEIDAGKIITLNDLDK